jgi:hypothetical protein
MNARYVFSKVNLMETDWVKRAFLCSKMSPFSSNIFKDNKTFFLIVFT